ncbi:MAG: hypothetical protein Sapg2KO_01410 [Saprospiraceae bacterium]
MEQEKLNWLVHTPAPNLTASENFYSRLGFSKLEASSNIWQSDACVVELNPDNFARAGIKLFASNWAETVEKIESLTSIYPITGGYLCFSPSGTAVYLIEVEQSFPVSNNTSLLGKYAGLSLESTNLEASTLFWEALDFKMKYGSPDQGWLSFVHSESLGVSIMKPLTCPHLFFNPSLTYFNGKENLAIIEKIRATGLPIAQEVTAFNSENIVDNIILRDPGGYGFFIFND